MSPVYECIVCSFTSKDENLMATHQAAQHANLGVKQWRVAAPKFKIVTSVSPDFPQADSGAGVDDDKEAKLQQRRSFLEAAYRNNLRMIKERRLRRLRGSISLQSNGKMEKIRRGSISKRTDYESVWMSTPLSSRSAIRVYSLVKKLKTKLKKQLTSPRLGTERIELLRELGRKNKLIQNQKLLMQNLTQIVEHYEDILNHHRQILIHQYEITDLEDLMLHHPDENNDNSDEILIQKCEILQLRYEMLKLRFEILRLKMENRSLE